MPNYDVERIVQELGIRITGGNDREIYALCPLHADSSPSFSINRKTGAWICYIGCGSDKERGIVQLVSQTQGVDEIKALMMLMNGYIKPITSEEIIGRIPIPKPEKRISFDTSLFQSFNRSYPRWFFDRGFDMDDVNRFQLLGDTSNASLIIPAYDHNGVCLGYITRVSPSQVSRLGYKYVLSDGLEKSKFLFGYNLVKRKSLQYNEPYQVWICEGALDCIWLHKFGHPAVSLLGINITQDHIELLKRTGVEEVVLILDNDERTETDKPWVKKGKEATAEIIKKIHNSFKLYKFIYPDDSVKDPQELTEEQLTNFQLERIYWS